MNLELALVGAVAGVECEVRTLSGEAREARFSPELAASGITVQPAQLVLIDIDGAFTSVLWRWLAGTVTSVDGDIATVREAAHGDVEARLDSALVGTVRAGDSVLLTSDVGGLSRPGVDFVVDDRSIAGRPADSESMAARVFPRIAGLYATWRGPARSS